MEKTFLKITGKTLESEHKNKKLGESRNRTYKQKTSQAQKNRKCNKQTTDDETQMQRKKKQEQEELINIKKEEQNQ